MDTAEIAALRDALIKVRLSAVREVRDSNGETIRYGTDAEMTRAIADAERRLAGAHSNTIRFSTSKGL